MINEIGKVMAIFLSEIVTAIFEGKAIGGSGDRVVIYMIA